MGLRDDYQSDGAVITAALRSPSRALRATRPLLRVYQQLNSSVGEFATETLIADTHAMAGTSHYRDVVRALRQLANKRDALATTIKVQLTRAAVSGSAPHRSVLRSEVRAARALLDQAHQLAQHT